MKKRTLSILLALTFVMLTMLSMTSFAAEQKDSYLDLLEQKRAFDKTYGFWHDYWYWFSLYSPSSTVLLYTHIGKDLTFHKYDDDEGDGIYFSAYETVLLAYQQHLLVDCEEFYLDNLGYEGPHNSREPISFWRTVVRKYNISREELDQAFKKMKEDPDSIRPLFNDIVTDEEFQYFKKDSILSYKQWPDFIWDAIFMEDEVMAYRLLCQPHAVFVPELGRVVTEDELYFSYGKETENNISWRTLAQFDLTTPALAEFISRKIEEYNYDPHVDPRPDSFAERLHDFVPAYQKQIDEKYGENALYMYQSDSFITSDMVFGKGTDKISISTLKKCDLTPRTVGFFLETARKNIAKYGTEKDPVDGRTPLEKLEYLEAAREAQLNAPQTGENTAVYLLLSVLSLGALAGTAFCLKRKY